MLLKAALVFLAVWLAGILGLYDAGRLVHIPLMVALAMLLLGGLKAREEAMRRASNSKPRTQ